MSEMHVGSGAYARLYVEDWSGFPSEPAKMVAVVCMLDDGAVRIQASPGGEAIVGALLREGVYAIYADGSEKRVLPSEGEAFIRACHAAFADSTGLVAHTPEEWEQRESLRSLTPTPPAASAVGGEANILAQ